MKKIVWLSLVTAVCLRAEGVDEALSGFDDAPVTQASATDEALSGFDDTSATQTNATDEALAGFDESSTIAPTSSGDTNASACETCKSNIAPPPQAEQGFLSDISGYVKQQAVWSYNGEAPHDAISSLRSTLFLDYEHKFEGGWKLKANARAYHDSIYDLRDEAYTSQELAQFRSEVELFDAYVEGSVSENFDVKIGRQVVVWGRSDTIRITDVLNPIDNRRPGMVDIEDLRLPVTMVKLDYFVGAWRITPMVIVEQRFTKDPPYGSALYPLSFALPPEEEASDLTYALSIGGEFSGWDVNLYGAHIYQDDKVINRPFTPQARIKHDKIDMAGIALNVLSGSWLFKAEAAYLDKLRYSLAPQKEFSRLDVLLGVEYNGIADTMISFDTSVRHLFDYDPRLGMRSLRLENGQEIALIPTYKDTYQHALRITSDFFNDTLHANFLVSLFGKGFDEGGFGRLWTTYDIDDSWQATIGVVDYIGGSALFDALQDADMVFVEMTYNF